MFCIVRDAMAVARDKMRPGVVMKEANQAVIDFYKKALRTAKLIRDDSARRIVRVSGRFFVAGFM